MIPSDSLNDFLINHEAHLIRLKETRRPEILTVDGEEAVVLMNAASYQELVDRLERAETIAAIQEGLASANRGELKDAHDVFTEMKARYGLSG